jgi:hypothetical protein
MSSPDAFEAVLDGFNFMSIKMGKDQRRKFQYVLMGAGLTLFVILGALILLSPAQASHSSDQTANEPVKDTGETTNEERPSTTTVALSEERPAVAELEEKDDRPNLGTPENPETDIAKILEQIRILVEKNETNLFGKPGWLYEKHEHYLPLKYTSNTDDIFGIPVTDLYGTDTVTREEWYKIDAEGHFQQKVGQTTDANGIIRTQWAKTNGQFVSLELVGVTEHAIRPADTINNPPLGSDLPAYLEMVETKRTTSVAAWFQTDQYVVAIKDTESFVNMIDELIQSTQIKYQFNLETGAIQLFEVTQQTSDGEWVVFERSLLLEQTVVEDLPPGAAQALSEASALTGGN